MTDAAEPSSLSASKLHGALLEYFGSPGKYQLTLRQPALLFASIREILQIAAGRGQLEGLPQAQASRLREAASFFVHAALLYPGADHYAVFGLARGQDPAELKDRYRLLMRLTHPDFANSAFGKGSDDAATRVNRAYEILSSPVLRRAYDEQLAAAARPPRAAELKKADARRPVLQPRHAARPGWKVNRTAAWSLAFGLGLLLVVFLFPARETGHLVQKTPAASARTWARDTAAASAAAAAATPLRPAEALAAASITDAARARAADPAAVAAAASQAPGAALALPAAPPAPALAAAGRGTPPPASSAATASIPAPPGPNLSAAELAANYRASVAAVASRPPTVARPADAAPPASRAPETSAAPVSPPAPTPAVIATPAVPAPVVARGALPLALPAGTAPTLDDAQPLLTQLLHLLESGSGEQLLRLLEGDGRHGAPAQALSRHYEQMVRGARPVRLSQVEFRSETRAGVLLVTGRVRLHAGEPTIGAHGERLMVRAEFVSRGGKVLLTGLSGAPD